MLAALLLVTVLGTVSTTVVLIRSLTSPQRSATPVAPAVAPTPAVSPAPTPGVAQRPATSAPAGPPCAYQTEQDGVDAPLPPTAAAESGVVRVTLRTTQGELALELDATKAPCTVNSFVSLARAGFFADSTCHRLTTAKIFVLQCGDPSETGTGGPGYRFHDENLPVGAAPAYPRGTVAMANAGPDTNGSQFFIVYRDSGIDPNYPVFGRVTAGLDVIDRVAASGAPDGDGPPNLSVIVEGVDIA
jgi:peptidyl-prolyl cis-trans isomerase B (cyclophilin B)